MIYTVTFNPAIDYVVRTGEMKVGVVNGLKRRDIFRRERINVSIILKNWELNLKLWDL